MGYVLGVKSAIYDFLLRNGMEKEIQMNI